MQDLKKKDKEDLRELRFLPDNFKLNTIMHIYSNKVTILTLNKEQLIGIIIENKEIAQMQKSIFEMMWGLCK